MFVWSDHDLPSTSDRKLQDIIMIIMLAKNISTSKSPFLQHVCRFYICFIETRYMGINTARKLKYYTDRIKQLSSQSFKPSKTDTAVCSSKSKTVREYHIGRPLLRNVWDVVTIELVRCILKVDSRR